MSGSPVEALSQLALDDDSRSVTTRTLAIIKTHALKHRMAIEKRILEASFEIIKERQMEFDTTSDQDFLHELFGRDTISLFEGPVWVYVLERRRAVEVWNALLGDPNPAVAREQSPNSLRALYGLSLEQNALAGSPDAQAAEDQISCLFQSSPPFAPADSSDLSQEFDERELGGVYDEHGEHVDWEGRYAHGSTLSPSSSQLSSTAQLSPHNSRSGSTRSRKTSSATNRSTGSNSTDRPKVLFRARPLPSTTHVPDSQPRTTRAAALRAGILLEPARRESGPRATPTKEELKQVFMDVPGHKRSSVIAVASTAAPVIAPRMTRAASLRISGPPEPNRARPRASTTGRVGPGQVSFEGVPGHKRRESITVESVQAPTVAPRLNKSAALRAKRDSAPPTSFMFRPPVDPKLPGALARSTSSSSLSPQSAQRPTLSRNSSSGQLDTSLSDPSERDRPAARPRSAAGRPPSVAGRPPSIEPRSNRSALLRAKKEQNGASSPGPGARKMPISKVSRVVAV